MIDPVDTPSSGRAVQSGSVAEIFTAFLRLGLTSFGGPIAHLGYFHRELIERRRWVDEAQYGQLLALCQFLPGPASSQLGFALGLIRGGWRGALAASFAFTAPSVLILLAFAQLMSLLDNPLGQAAIHGLKLVAVAVVAHGLLGMARTLAPDAPRRLIAIASASIILVTGSAAIQLLAVATGALLGVFICRNVRLPAADGFPLRYVTHTGLLLLCIFTLLLAIALTPIASESPLASVAAAFYRAGALVFGGGHVVLPLLQEAVVTPGWVTQDDFLAGYGGAQAVPGPMFSLAAFLGARIENIGGTGVGALVSLLAILLPGFLLVAGVLPVWRSITQYPGAARALAGVNAAVVGLLAAALYDPVWTSAIRGLPDFAIVLAGFVLLVALRTSSLLVVAWCVIASTLRTLLS
ncbi:MAG TPA: chromate efflux transporter [Steroidobacter sp.]|uniref:chromate efflux transporter n=1 Tax=Steroidobacter sp. TaxID=1978227 RepID=UPI002ED83DDF